MDFLTSFLLETEVRPLLSPEEVAAAKSLMTEHGLIPRAELAFDFSASPETLSTAELRYHLKMNPKITEIEDLADSVFLVKFSDFSSSLNFLKLFTFTNFICGSRFFFKLWYDSEDDWSESDSNSFKRGSLASESTLHSIRCSKNQKEKPLQKPFSPGSRASGQKLVTKFYLSVENRPDFEISKKIIGKKGKNMKQIIRAVEDKLTLEGTHDSAVGHNFLKLRLRGKGSCFKEGREEAESQERLHLCVSSWRADVHREAVSAVERLLAGIRQQFESFWGEEVPEGGFYEVVTNYV